MRQQTFELLFFSNNNVCISQYCFQLHRLVSNQFFNLAAFLTKKRQITSLGVLYFKELWNLENLGIAQLDKLSWQAYNLDSTRASWIIV